jgi:hypothetical protein
MYTYLLISSTYLSNSTVILSCGKKSQDTDLRKPSHACSNVGPKPIAKRCPCKQLPLLDNARSNRIIYGKARKKETTRNI